MDDLQNQWGTILVDASAVGSSTRGQGQSILVGDDNTERERFNSIVSSRTQHKFSLYHIESCRSVANQLAITEATYGDTNACVFAVGSYICGDGGYYNELSLNSRQIGTGGACSSHQGGGSFCSAGRCSCHTTLLHSSTPEP